MMEWLLLNNKHGNDTLWIPDALHWRHTLLWNWELYQLPTHPRSDCTPGIFPYLATALTSANNTPLASPATASDNPALTAYFPWMATYQHHHQNPIQLPWAINLQAFDYHLWPP